MRVLASPMICGAMRIEGKYEGPRIVIFAGEHSDEPCGAYAIEKLFYDFSMGARELLKGTLTLVRANEVALAENKRYVVHNLNRLYKDTNAESTDMSSYEYLRAQELKPLLRECNYFLTLHSAPIADEPFLVVEERHVEAFRPMGIRKFVTGWGAFDVLGGDSEGYANTYGAVACTLEAGNHTDMTGISVAYSAVLSMLTHWGMIADELPQSSGRPEIFRIYEVIIKREPFSWMGSARRNFDFIRRGEFVCMNGKEYLQTEEDAYLLMPSPAEKQRVGEEIGYLARKL